MRKILRASCIFKAYANESYLLLTSTDYLAIVHIYLCRKGKNVFEFPKNLRMPRIMLKVQKYVLSLRIFKKGEFCRTSRDIHITYKVPQTMQMKLILLCAWAEPAVLGSTKTALKFKYEI